MNDGIYRLLVSSSSLFQEEPVKLTTTIYTGITYATTPKVITLDARSFPATPPNFLNEISNTTTLPAG